MWIMPGVLVFWVLSNLWKVTTQSKCVFLPLEAFSDVTILCINRLIHSYLLIFTFFFFPNTIWKQDLNWFPFLTFHISLAVRPRTSHCRVPQFLSCKVGGRPCLVRRAVTCSWPPASVCSRGGRERDPSEVVRSSRSGEGDRVVPLVSVSYSPNSSDQSWHLFYEMYYFGSFSSWEASVC